jgi:hypothetical protein
MNPVGSYPRQMGEGRAGLDLASGNSMLHNKVLISWPVKKQETPFAGSARSGILYFDFQHRMWSSEFLSPVTRLDELKRQKA